MRQSRALIGLDVGEKRIGVALASAGVPIAVPLTTLSVDGSEIEHIVRLADKEQAGVVIIGYPRNQSGEPTAQTAEVETFARKLAAATPVTLTFQDESLTSVHAEQRLKVHGRPYDKRDIDAQAAAIILQDYLEGAHEE